MGLNYFENLNSRKEIGGEGREIVTDKDSFQSIKNPSMDINRFVAQVYKLFAGTLIGGATGAYIGSKLIEGKSGLFFIIALVIEIGLIFAIRRYKRVSPTNLVLLFLFSFITGAVLGPTIGFLINSGREAVLAEALILTSISFFGLTWYGMVTKRDLRSWGSVLFIALVVLIGATFLNLFFHSSLLNTAISAFGAILFGILTIYDTQTIIKGDVETPVEGALILYLDFINLLTFILNLLLGGED